MLVSHTHGVTGQRWLPLPATLTPGATVSSPSQPATRELIGRGEHDLVQEAPGPVPPPPAPRSNPNNSSTRPSVPGRFNTGAPARVVIVVCPPGLPFLSL